MLVFEIVAKLKNSAFAEEELKLAVHGFPLAIEKEVSDTTTEHTDKSEEKLKQETVPHADPATEQPSSYTGRIQTTDLYHTNENHIMRCR